MRVTRVGNKLNVPFGPGGNFLVQLDVPLTATDRGSKAEYAEASKWARDAAAALFNAAAREGTYYDLTRHDLASLLLAAVLKG